MPEMQISLPNNTEKAGRSKALWDPNSPPHQNQLLIEGLKKRLKDREPNYRIDTPLPFPSQCAWCNFELSLDGKGADGFTFWTEKNSNGMLRLELRGVCRKHTLEGREHGEIVWYDSAEHIKILNAVHEK
jgi:hypothetical protein